MSRLTILLSLTVTAAILALASPFSRSEAQPLPTGTSNGPVLLELFTSQGCSSCPPADRLAAKLDQEDDLVVLSRPVDYWDRLGWKDTFAKPSNTALQRAYARRRLAGYNGVYTPQTVVNGASGEVGSDERALRGMIAQNGASQAAIRVRAVPGKGFALGLAGKAPNEAELILVGVSSREDVSIGRGENRGRTIEYTNVVLDEAAIARWNGGPMSLPVLESDLARVSGDGRADRFAAVLREPGGGRVLAASWLR